MLKFACKATGVDCDFVATGETVEEIKEKAFAHAGVVHAEILNSMTDEQKALFGIDRLNVPRSSIPAVTHIDYSARIQTVHQDTNPRYHALISRFKALTGCPVIVNTSFNMHEEPIVCTPNDALRAFRDGHLDYLAIGRFLIKNPELPSPSRREDAAAVGAVLHQSGVRT